MLITCFNYAAYVGQAIDSVLEQTYPPAEIIVSDDASQDNSCEVVETYISRSPGIRLLRNPHGGMAANLNAAYRNCSGDIICLLDADDTFLPGKIEAVVNAFLAHPQAGFAIHRASLVDNQKRARGVYPLLSALPSGDCGQTTYDNSGILMGLPPTTNLALRREVADRIFPIPVEYTGYAEQMIHSIALVQNALLLSANLRDFQQAPGLRVENWLDCTSLCLSSLPHCGKGPFCKAATKAEVEAMVISGFPVQLWTAPRFSRSYGRTNLLPPRSSRHRGTSMALSKSRRKSSRPSSDRMPTVTPKS